MIVRLPYRKTNIMMPGNIRTTFRNFLELKQTTNKRGNHLPKLILLQRRKNEVTDNVPSPFLGETGFKTNPGTTGYTDSLILAFPGLIIYLQFLGGTMIPECASIAFSGIQDARIRIQIPERTDVMDMGIHLISPMTARNNSAEGADKFIGINLLLDVRHLKTVDAILGKVDPIETDSMTGKEKKKILPASAPVLELMTGSCRHINHKTFGDAPGAGIRTAFRPDVERFGIEKAIIKTFGPKSLVTAYELGHIDPKNTEQFTGIPVQGRRCEIAPDAGKSKPINDGNYLLMDILHKELPFFRQPSGFFD
jgi:hypothetical protein